MKAHPTGHSDTPLKYLTKRTWERIHGVAAVHHDAFAALGWEWTPVRCKHSKPHMLNTEEWNKKEERQCLSA